MQYAIDGRYIQDHFPGIGRYTYNLIDALARVAPDETFVVLHNPALRNTRYDVDALGRYANIEMRRVDVPTFSVREQFQLPTSGVRLFHCPYYIMPYVSRVPSVVTLFDLIPLRAPDDPFSPRVRLFFRLAVSLAARTAVRIIAPSAAARDDLTALLGVPREKITVIPLAADARFVPRPAAEISRVREKYSLPAEYVLSVGINKPHKNLTTLIDAWQSMQHAQRTLVIAGAWDARYPIEQKDAGQAAIQFIRNVDNADLPALYSGAAVFVMPSLYEGFGLPLLEAMACGAPVVCSNAASLPEVVGDAALLVNPRDVGEIAGTIQRVLSDAALRDELRAKGIARAAQFTWERAAREALRVYESVVKQGR